MSLTEFRRSFSVNQAVAYLQSIRNWLRADAITHYREGHFYTPLRHAFAEIDGVAKLYAGARGKGDTAPNTVGFGAEYLARVNPRYRDIFGLVFDMYRHGLAHTRMTKSVRFRDARNRWVTLGWAMTDEDPHKVRHLSIEQIDTSDFRIWLHVLQMVEDTLTAIDLYAADLQANSSRLFPLFKRGYEGTASVFQEPSVPVPSAGTSPKVKQRSKQVGKGKSRKAQKPLTTNVYSTAGIALVRSDIAQKNTWKQVAGTG
jgi:hypothetical protein